MVSVLDDLIALSEVPDGMTPEEDETATRGGVASSTLVRARAHLAVRSAG
jgi:hypothetical protein